MGWWCGPVRSVSSRMQLPHKAARFGHAHAHVAAAHSKAAGPGSGGLLNQPMHVMLLVTDSPSFRQSEATSLPSSLLNPI